MPTFSCQTAGDEARVLSKFEIYCQPSCNNYTLVYRASFKGGQRGVPPPPPPPPGDFLDEALRV